MTEFDYDWVVIGSGFGGSVAALRLAERGYSVGVLECGKRWATEDLPKTTWNLRKYIWMPKLGLRGILRLTFFKDVSIISGSGVGGGSLVYGETLYRAGDDFREHLDAAVGEHVDLDPFYDAAEFMLGVVENPRPSSRDKMVLSTAADLGIDTAGFHPTRVGVFFGEEPGRTVPDPYFGGEGPDRAGCVECGRCMVGCRYNAKNTLDKNYLYLAERRGAEVWPERFVADVKPIAAKDGSDGYEITSQRSGSWVRKQKQTVRARGVVFAAGPVGTNQLLADCKYGGSLPGLSDRIGMDVRTNAESIGAVTWRDGDADLDGREAAAEPLGEHGHPLVDGGDGVGLGAGEVDAPQTKRVAAGQGQAGEAAGGGGGLFGEAIELLPEAIEAGLLAVAGLGAGDEGVAALAGPVEDAIGCGEPLAHGGLDRDLALARRSLGGQAFAGHGIEAGA